MQMADDARRLTQLGVATDKIVICGNLKYDISPPQTTEATLNLADCGLDCGPLLVAGSTHVGEEMILLDALALLRPTHPNLGMVIAPRQIERSREVLALATRCGLVCRLRTDRAVYPCQVLVLDTLGELAAVYRQADLAFIGGSLVKQGGHNPLEPASFGRPVLFGPDMTDFAEISHDLLQAGGALQVTVKDLATTVADLLADEGKRQRMGRLAGELVLAHQGATLRTLALIREIIGHG